MNNECTSGYDCLKAAKDFFYFRNLGLLHSKRFQQMLILAFEEISPCTTFPQIALFSDFRELPCICLLTFLSSATNYDNDVVITT